MAMVMEEAQALGDGPEPWERQDDETPKAWGAFVVYRDMGPRRSLRRVQSEEGTALAQLGQWSSRYRWVERAAAWDGHLDLIRRQEQVDAVRNMRERHATTARKLLDVAVDSLEKRLSEAEVEEAPLLATYDILRYVVEAAKLERLALGEADTVVDNRHSGLVQVEAEQEVTLRVLGSPEGLEAAKQMQRVLAASVQAAVEDESPAQA